MATIDIIFIATVMKKQYALMLNQYLRASSVHWPSAFGAWLLISLGLVIFVIPIIQKENTFISLLYGFVYGLVIYGTYEATNYAIINNWPLKFACIDVIWGITLTILCTMFVKFLY